MPEPKNLFLNPWNIHLKLKHSKPRQNKPFTFTPLEARIALSMTQSAIAGTIGISLRTWQNMEYDPLRMNRRDYMALRYLISIKDPHARQNINRNVNLKINAAQKIVADFSNEGVSLEPVKTTPFKNDLL